MNSEGFVNYNSQAQDSGTQASVSVVNTASPTGYLAESVVAQHQADAVRVSQPAPVQEVRNVRANTFDFNVVLTLNLANSTIANNKDELKSLPLTVPDGTTVDFNLHNPFAGVSKQGPAVAEGVLRSVFGGILALASDFNKRQVVYLAGDDATPAISAMVRSFADTVQKEVSLRLPGSPEMPIMEFELAPADEESDTGDEPETMTLVLSDLLQVKTWARVEEDGVDNNKACIVLNVIVSPGALYDSEDPGRYVSAAYSFLQKQFSAANPDSSAEAPLLCVLIDSADLTQPLVQELLASLSERFVGLDVLSLAKARDGDYESFLPADATDKLFAWGDLAVLLSERAPAAE